MPDEAAPIAAAAPVAAPPEPERHRSLLRYWFGWKAAG
jgi:hypothetical protein